jgi:hypothetical protein
LAGGEGLPLVAWRLTQEEKYNEFTHAPLLKHFLSIADPGGAEPVPDSALIYFEQIGSYLPPISSTSSGSSPNYLNLDGSNGFGFNTNATINFEPGNLPVESH